MIDHDGSRTLVTDAVPWPRPLSTTWMEVIRRGRSSHEVRPRAMSPGRERDGGDVTPGKGPGRPWLGRPEWSGGTARATGGELLFAHWFGAVVWNLLCLPLAVAAFLDRLVDVPFFIELVIYGFGALGGLILVRAIVQTRRVLRFRGLGLELDPFPGSIGGQIGGSVDVPVPAGDAGEVRVTLHCIHSHVRGTGDDRRRREDVVWSAQTIADVGRSSVGTRLSFVFDVPDSDLPESGIDEGDHHYWSIHLAAELSGADLDQTFVVPVYRVDPPLRSGISFDPPEADTRDLAERGIAVERRARGLRIDYRRGRYGLAPYALLAFGSLCMMAGGFVFASVGGSESGLGLVGTAVGGVFLAVFGLVGILVVVFALRLLSYGLAVEIDGDTIRVEKSFLLFGSTSEVRASELARMEVEVGMQTGQGAGAKTTYTVHGILDSGGRMTLGDGIRGAYLLNRIRAHLEAETGVGMRMEARRG